MLKEICSDIYSVDEPFNIKNISGRHAMSERYIQRLFQAAVGLTPRTFYKIQRFNKSLELVKGMKLSLTSVAYDCGYHDQAHFIREFREFTGLKPSEVRSSYIVGQAL